MADRIRTSKKSGNAPPRPGGTTAPGKGGKTVPGGGVPKPGSKPSSS